MIIYPPNGEMIPPVDTEDEESADTALSIMGMTPAGTLNEKIQTFRNMGFEER